MVRKTQYDSYDDQFKATAVELGELRGVKAIDIAELLEIHPRMLYRWKKENREGVIVKKKHPILFSSKKEVFKFIDKVDIPIKFAVSRVQRQSIWILFLEATWCIET